MTRASIIIPALNEAHNIARTLREVFSQIDPSDEVIVVDNGSSDATVATARSFGAIVIVESARGRSQARNAGIKVSHGEIVVFLDADCRPGPGWLVHLLKGFDDATVGCVGGEIVNSEISTSFGKYLNDKGHLSQVNTFSHPFLPYAQSGNVAFLRKVLDQIGHFDELLVHGHDADLCWRMQLQSDFKLVLTTEAAVFHEFDLTAKAFFFQKRRHALGGVLLYKKYASYRDSERQPLKVLYWEYRSILKRILRYGSRLALTRLGIAAEPLHQDGYQLLIEVGEKWGRIEGSLRYRTLFL